MKINCDKFQIPGHIDCSTFCLVLNMFMNEIGKGAKYIYAG